MPTAISEIHAIPQDERAQRSALVPSKAYMPYLSLTSGEFKLANYLDQAKMLWRYTGKPAYGEAVKMLDNALYKGVHNGIQFIGAVPDELQNVARIITTAKRDTKPASGSILLDRPGIQRPNGIASGVHIGENILPHDSTLDDCNKYAIQYVKRYYNSLSTAQIIARIAIPLLNQNIVKKYNEGKAECKNKRDIEALMNQGITDFGHHTLYGFLPSSNKFTSSIITKNILQGAAHEDLARIAATDKANMKLWLNTAIMRRNSTTSIGPLDQLQSNIAWTGLPAEGINEFWAWYNITVQNKRNAVLLLIPGKLSELFKKYGQPNIGVDPATTALIVNTLKTMFVALLAAAPAIISALNNKKADAFAGARGIGTEAFGPQSGDWDGNGIPDNQEKDNTLLWLGAAAAGIYLYTRD